MFRNLGLQALLVVNMEIGVFIRVWIKFKFFFIQGNMAVGSRRKPRFGLLLLPIARRGWLLFSETSPYMCRMRLLSCVFCLLRGVCRYWRQSTHSMWHAISRHAD